MSNTNDLINAAFPKGALFPLPWFGGFVASSPVIPQLYWDVYSAEQRWKTICCDLKKLVEYANQQSANINDNHEAILLLQQLVQDFPQDMKDLEQLVNEALAAVDREIANLNAYIDEQLKDIAESAEAWDVTQGKYGLSQQVNRDLFIACTYAGMQLFTFNEKCREIDFTCQQLADSGLNCLGLAAIAYTIFDEQLFKAYKYQYKPITIQ